MWTPMTDDLNGNWWFTGAPQRDACSIGDPCTWQEVLTAFPDAGIDATRGAVILKAGSGWAGFVGNVDALTVNDVTYDFDLTKDDCKNGGWETTFASLGFRNQGDCVRYFESRGR